MQPHPPDWLDGGKPALCPLQFRRDRPEEFDRLALLSMWSDKGILPSPGGPARQTRAYSDGVLAYQAGIASGRRRMEDNARSGSSAGSNKAERHRKARARR